MLGPSRRTPAVAYLAVALASLALYALALLAARPPAGRVPRPLIFGFPLLFAAALLLMYPPTAVDLFHYHADARTLWLHGRNPLVVSPAETDYLLSISWAEQPSPYGPLWSLLTAVIAPLMLLGGYPLLEVLGLKVLAAGSYFACSVLVYHLVARSRPSWAPFAVVLFAWNPFVLLRVVGNGHNDLVMMAFALLALLYARERRWTPALPLLAASVLVKYSSALLGPPLLLYAWTHSEGSPVERARALAPGAALAAALAIASYAPFWAGEATFATLLQQSRQMITSTPHLLFTLLDGQLAEDTASTVARNTMLLVFLAFAVPLTWSARRGFDALVIASASLLLLYLVLAAGWFRPWYMLWPAALLALHPTRWSVALFLALTGANLFPDLVEQYRYDWGVRTLLEARLAPVLVQFALPLAVWLAALWRTGDITLGAGSAGGPPAAPAAPPRAANAGQERGFERKTR